MKTTLNTVSATEIKNRFGDYLHGVLTDHAPLLIEKHGKPVAIIMEYAEWKKREALSSKKSWVEQCRRYATSLKKRHPHSKIFSGVDLIRSVREEEDRS